MLSQGPSLAFVAAELPTKIYAAVPYYNAYELLPRYFDSRLFEWAANETDLQPNQPVIDIVTAPNNPDGAMRNKSIAGAFGFYDHAYFWPHFTPITGPVEYGQEDIACFTLSKLTGHAGQLIQHSIIHKGPCLWRRKPPGH